MIFNQICGLIVEVAEEASLVRKDNLLDGNGVEEIPVSKKYGYYKDVIRNSPINECLRNFLRAMK